MSHASSFRSSLLCRSALLWALLVPGLWLALPGSLFAQGEYEATMYGVDDFSAWRYLPTAHADTVLTFDYRGHWVPEGDTWPPAAFVCTEIWYLQGGKWDMETMKAVCFQTDADGDYFRILYQATSLDPNAAFGLWDQDGVITCDGGTGKYAGVQCDLQGRSLGLGSGWYRATFKGTFGVK